MSIALVNFWNFNYVVTILLRFYFLCVLYSSADNASTFESVTAIQGKVAVSPTATYGTSRATSSDFFKTATNSEENLIVSTNTTDRIDVETVSGIPKTVTFNQTLIALTTTEEPPRETSTSGIDNQGSYSLHIDMVNQFGEPYYAEYDLFRINDEADKYRLSELGIFDGILILLIT